jgi:hypothetical protein
MSLADICCGEKHCSKPTSTAASNRGDPDSFPVLGRDSARCARRCAATARYLSRPPHPPISRHTVDAERPNARAIARPDSPAAIPRLIRSRSENDNRCREHATRRRANHTSSAIRYTVDSEDPNAATIPATRSPARTRAATRSRSPGLNHRYDPRRPALLDTLISNHSTHNTMVLRRPDETTHALTRPASSRRPQNRRKARR